MNLMFFYKMHLSSYLGTMTSPRPLPIIWEMGTLGPGEFAAGWGLPVPRVGAYHEQYHDFPPGVRHGPLVLGVDAWFSAVLFDLRLFPLLSIPPPQPPSTLQFPSANVRLSSPTRKRTPRGVRQRALLLPQPRYTPTPA